MKCLWQLLIFHDWWKHSRDYCWVTFPCTFLSNTSRSLTHKIKEKEQHQQIKVTYSAAWTGMEERYRGHVFIFIFSSSYLLNWFTFSEGLNLAINAWSIHINHRDPSNLCQSSCLLYWTSPQSCMTTTLIKHLSKNNKEAAYSKRGQFYQTSL